MSHPSIFNDVLGPVMRGPSSSHTAASWRIGTVAVKLLGEQLKHALVEFDENGAWAPNYAEQGTVLGMDGGLLGIDIIDERIIDGPAVAAAKGIDIEYRVSRFPTDHANTVRLTLTGEHGERLVLVAVSLGGGMFEIRMFNGRRRIALRPEERNSTIHMVETSWASTFAAAAPLTPHPNTKMNTGSRRMDMPVPMSTETMATVVLPTPKGPARR